MKTLLLLSLFLTACGGSKGGAKSAPHVVDSTPHVYDATFYSLTDQLTHQLATITAICDFGNVGGHTATADFDFLAPNIAGGVGCGGLIKNYNLSAINNGTAILHLDLRIDGVSQFPGGLEVQPGTTFTFQRGF